MTGIVVKLQHEATHFWENADSIPEVSFLKHPHRHIFHITLLKEVSHDDRDIEIIQMKRQVQEYLQKQYGRNFGGKSCEMIARELLELYGCLSVEVLEDGENGAFVTNGK